MAEAIIRIKADIAVKGVKFFDEIDQSKLAADAGIKLRPSTLPFGNPPLGTQFITSNPWRRFRNYCPRWTPMRPRGFRRRASGSGCRSGQVLGSSASRQPADGSALSLLTRASKGQP